jgi:hypothetical protein
VTSLAAATAAFQAERGKTRRRPSRSPFTVRAAAVAGRLLPRWERFRRTCLVVAGFGSLTAAAWLVAVPAGLVAAGVSLLLLDFLSAGD